MTKQEAREKVKLTIVHGLAEIGVAVYINDYRVVGPKPLGGGRIAHSWAIDRQEIEKALYTPYPS